MLVCGSLMQGLDLAHGLWPCPTLHELAHASGMGPNLGPNARLCGIGTFKVPKGHFRLHLIRMFSTCVLELMVLFLEPIFIRFYKMAQKGHEQGYSLADSILRPWPDAWPLAMPYLAEGQRPSISPRLTPWFGP